MRGKNKLSVMLILWPDWDPPNLTFSVYCYGCACQHHLLSDILSNSLCFKEGICFIIFFFPFFLERVRGDCDLWSPVACSSGSFVNCCQHFLVFNLHTAPKKKTVSLKDFKLAFLGVFSD